MSDGENQSAWGDTCHGAFPATLWTVVSEASQGATPQAVEALGKLCAAYRQPILNWLLRKGHSPAQAEDLAHGFLEFLLEKNRLTSFVRGDTKFRSFLLKCLGGFLRDEWRKTTAAKRGGGVEPVPIEEHEVGVSTDLERQLDRDFALTVHRQALTRLREKSERLGNLPRFETLQPFIMRGDAAGSYADVATKLGLKPNAVKKAVFDLREAYCHFFRNEVAQTVSPAQLEEEMRYLITLLADVGASDAERPG